MKETKEMEITGDMIAESKPPDDESSMKLMWAGSLASQAAMEIWRTPAAQLQWKWIPAQWNCKIRTRQQLLQPLNQH